MSPSLSLKYRIVLQRAVLALTLVIAGRVMWLSSSALGQARSSNFVENSDTGNIGDQPAPRLVETCGGDDDDDDDDGGGGGGGGGGNSDNDEGDGVDGDGDDCDLGNGGGRGRGGLQGTIAATGRTRTGVMLGMGALVHGVRDAATPLRGPNWRQGALYVSDPTMISTLTNQNGYGWFAAGNPFLLINGTTYETVLDNCSTLQFTKDGISYDPPDHARATLVADGTDLCLTFEETGAELFFDNNSSNATYKCLTKQKTRYGDTVVYDWDTTSFTHPRMCQVTLDNAGVGGTDWCVEYNYASSGNNNEKCTDVQVHAGSPTATVIQKCEYTYDDDSNGDYSADLGLNGDLVLCTVKTKLTGDTGATFSKTRETLCRYYKAADSDGGDHQMKHIFSAATCKAILDADGTLSSGDEILEKDDTYAVGGMGGTTIAGYADKVIKYYTGTFNTNVDLGMGDNLETKYNPATDSDSANETGFVREIVTRTGCAGCGGGGAGEGTYTYYYMSRGGTGVNNIEKIVVENQPNGGRRVYGISNTGHVLRELFEDDYDGGTVNRWYTSYKLADTTDDSKYMVTERQMPSAHTVTTVKDFFDPGKDSTVVNNSTGLIYVYEYNSGGYPTVTKLKKGETGTAFKLTETAYSETDRPDLATQRIRYRTETSQTTEANKEVTDIVYTFHDGGKKQLKTRATKNEGVPTTENGPGTAAGDRAVFDSFFNTRGQLRWTRNAEGFVSYQGYDAETGITTLRVADVNTSTLPTSVDNDWDGTDYGYASDDTVPFSRTGGGTALSLETTRLVDDRGRVTKATDPEGVITYRNYLDGEQRVYGAWDAATDKPLLPLRITKTDHAGRVTESILADPAGITFADPPDAGATETSSISQADYVTWTTNTYNDKGQLAGVRRYHNIPSSGDGTLVTNYYETLFQYDSEGDREYQIDIVADGSGSYEFEQVSKRTRDALGRVTQVEQGVSSDTHDMGSSYTTYPTLTVTSKTYYDDPDSDSTPEQGVGDGNVSWTRRYFGSVDADSTLTNFLYNWRNRRIVTLRYDDDASDGQAPHSLVKLDNLGRTLATAQYSAVTGLDVDDDPTSLATNRLTLSETAYDQMGRVYRTTQWEIDDGDTGIDLVSNTYFDRNSRRVASDAANTGVVETQYDGVGRVTATRQATALEATKYSSGAFDYLDDDENIVQVFENTYDKVGNVTKTISKELNHDDTNGMDLTANDDYIRTYVYRWYDGANRLTDVANYGTNNSNGWKDNSTAPTYGASAPARSDTILVTTNTYDGAGRRSKVTDPAAVDTAYTYDDLGRTTQIDEADGQTEERITKYEFDGNGSLTKIKAYLAGEYDSGNSGNDTQVTEYAYTDAQNRRWVTKIGYPTTHDTAGTATADTIAYTYNVDGTVATRRDQNNSTITYDYDDSRRKTAERVTTLASGVDGAVRAITYTYTSRGQFEYVTNHSDDTPDTTTWADAIAQVKHEYNGLGMITKVRQDADSEVDKTGGVTTQDTVYTYDLSASSGNNRSRLDYITYPGPDPTGRIVWMGYTHWDAANTFQDTINDAFNRVGQVAKDNAGAKGDKIAQYDFNGLGRMVRRTSDDGTGWDGNDTRLDLWGGTSGDYDGFDRFGRIADLRHTTMSYGGPLPKLAGLKYGYDRAGNRTDVEDGLHRLRSHVYTYDKLHRLDKAQQGILNSGKTDTPLSDLERDWTLDDLGNWTALKTNQVASNVTHAVNSTNEITTYDVANEAGAPLLVDDAFASEDTDVWTEKAGTFSVPAGQLQVDTLTSGVALDTVGDWHFGYNFATVAVTFSADTGRSGLVFAYTDTSNFWAAVLDAAADTLEVFQVVGGNWGNPKASSSVTVSASTAYTLRHEIREKHILFTGAGGKITHNPSASLAEGPIGVVSDVTATTYDTFQLYDLAFTEGPPPAASAARPRPPMTRPTTSWTSTTPTTRASLSSKGCGRTTSSSRPASARSRAGSSSAIRIRTTTTASASSSATNFGCTASMTGRRRPCTPPRPP